MGRLAIYGIGQSFYDALYDLFHGGHFFELWNNTALLVDNDARKKGHSICGKTISHPSEISFDDIDMVLVATERFFDDSFDLLTRQYGVDTGKIQSLQKYMSEAAWTADDNLPFVATSVKAFDFVALDLAQGLVDADGYSSHMWHDCGDNKEDYMNNVAINASNRLLPYLRAAGQKHITSEKTAKFTAFCDVCLEHTTMTVAHLSRRDFVDWKQSVCCDKCGINPRQRAVMAFLRNIARADPQTSEIYIAERVTKFYSELAKCYENVIGSEFLSPAYTGGQEYPYKDKMIRHEDLTKLSFSDNRFDYIITQDVFEHVANYELAFHECFRVLKNNGKLIFTVPFHHLSDKTIVRACIDDKYEVTHLLPPEIHGNPLSGDGSLCFQNIGWDIFDLMKQCGFSNAKIQACWSPKNGYMQAINVFSADKLI